MRWGVAAAAPLLAGAVVFARAPTSLAEDAAGPAVELEEKVDPTALQMKADELEIDLENKRAELRGNVQLSRGDLTIKCPTVSVRYGDDHEVREAKGTGGVVAEAKGIRGEAPEVTLDLATKTVSLEGGVRVTQKNAVVRAARATLHLETGRVVLYKVEGTLPTPAKP